MATEFSFEGEIHVLRERFVKFSHSGCASVHQELVAF